MRARASPEIATGKRRQSAASPPPGANSGLARRKRARIRDDRAHGLHLPTRAEYVVHRGLSALLQPLARAAGEAGGPTAVPAREVELRVAPYHLTTSNRAVATRQLWGSGEYTDDSDVVAMLAHGGHYVLTSQPVPARFDCLSVRLRAVRHMRGMPPFESREANGIRSRFWSTAYDGYRISILSVAAVKGDTETVLAKPLLARLGPHIPYLRRWGDADSSPASDISLSFDLLNEPCLCFTITALADKGTDPRSWPSRRLINEVLYLENLTTRYELAAVYPQPHSSEGQDSTMTDDLERMPFEEMELRFSRLKPEIICKLRAEKYVWSCTGSASFGSLAVEVDSKLENSYSDVDKSVKGNPMALSSREGHRSRQLGAPLPDDTVDLIATLNWSDLHWSPDGVTVHGTHYPISKLVFSPITSHLNSTRSQVGRP